MELCLHYLMCFHVVVFLLSTGTLSANSVYSKVSRRNERNGTMYKLYMNYKNSEQISKKKGNM